MKMPAWVIPFLLACIALPIYTRGGALWGALGVGAAFGCHHIATNASADWPLATRVVVCTLLSAAPWGIWLLFMR